MLTGVSARPQPTDLYNHLLLNRVVFLRGYVNDVTAAKVVGSMLSLEALDSTEDIVLYINSPGGMHYNICGIVDTIRTLKCDVATVVVGTASNLGAVIAAAGAKGKRSAMPNARLMVKQPQGGMQGSSFECAITAAELQRNFAQTVSWITEFTGMEREETEQMIDRETYMSASQAIEAGFLDSVVGGDTSMQDKVEAEFQAFLAEAHKPRAQVPDDPLPRRPGYSLPEAEMDAELEGEQARFLRAFERWHAENGGAALGAEEGAGEQGGGAGAVATAEGEAEAEAGTEAEAEA